jgi:outer membrane murein-binding lipoprotein Lpp
MVIGRFRLVIIAIAVVIIGGFAVLSAQIWLMNARIDQLATKVNAIDATFRVKFDETNAKLDAASAKFDAISQRLPTEFNTIRAEITAQTSAIAKSIASLRGLAPSPPTSLLPEPATGPKPAPPPNARP